MINMPISLESLELFPDYDPSRPETAEGIYERIRNLQKSHDGQTRHRILEDENIGVSRLATKFEFYPIVRKMFNYEKVFVDAGCGLGTDLRKVIKDGINPERALGITIMPDEIEWGFELYQDKGIPKHSGQYIVSDLRNMGIGDESVDFLSNIAIIHTLKKKENVLGFLGGAKRVLRPGGLFFGRTGGDFKEKDGPHYRISKESLENYLREQGFGDIGIKEYERTKPITFKYVSSKMRSEEPRKSLEPVMLHFIAHRY